MLLSTVPKLSVSCSRKAICNVLKVFSEASSITALSWFSNSTGSTTTLRGIALKDTEPTGTKSSFGSLISIRRLSAAHWPIRPSPMRMDCGCPLTSSSA